MVAVEDGDRELRAALERAEAALGAQEARFDALFTSIDEGCCICELLVDDAGAPVDYRFVEVNALFEEMTGLHDVLGRRAYELVPGLERGWLERYAEVAIGRRPARFEDGSAAMGRWFDVFAMPIEPERHFLLLFRDISERRRGEEALRESEARFRNMADSSPVMVWVTDRAGTCTYLNRSWYEFTGQPPEGGLGRRRLDAAHDDDREGCADAFLAANETAQPFRIEYRLRHHDGSYRWVIDSAAPRTGSNGELLGFVGSVIDISERKQAEEALRDRERAERRRRWRAELMTTVMTGLEGARGAHARGERFVELLVPVVGDVAALALSDGPTHVAPAHVGDEVLPEDGWDLGVSRGGSRVVVPVDLGAGTRGRLLVELTDTARPRFDDGDLAFVAELVGHAAVLLGAARLSEQEHRVAVRLQRALLPDELVEHPDVLLAARYQAAGDGLDVGGDWYETFVVPDGRLGVAVGDVMGHGLEAAAVMGRMRAGLVALAAHTDSPARLVDDLDHFASGDGGPAFATACCAFLDPATGRLTYASAGHPPVLVLGPDGAATWLEGGASWPLCTPVDEPRPEASLVLEPGSLVVLYSDGLVERRAELLSDGLVRLEATARRLCRAPVDHVCDGLLAGMADGSPYGDDVVVLALRFAPDRPLPA